MHASVHIMYYMQYIWTHICICICIFVRILCMNRTDISVRNYACNLQNARISAIIVFQQTCSRRCWYPCSQYCEKKDANFGKVPAHLCLHIFCVYCAVAVGSRQVFLNGFKHVQLLSLKTSSNFEGLTRAGLLTAGPFYTHPPTMCLKRRVNCRLYSGLTPWCQASQALL